MSTHKNCFIRGLVFIFDVEIEVGIRKLFTPPPRAYAERLLDIKLNGLPLAHATSASLH